MPPLSAETGSLLFDETVLDCKCYGSLAGGSSSTRRSNFSSGAIQPPLIVFKIQHAPRSKLLSQTWEVAGTTAERQIFGLSLLSEICLTFMGTLLRLLIAPRTVDEKHSFWLAGLHSIAPSAETVYPIQPPRRLAVPPLLQPVPLPRPSRGSRNEAEVPLMPWYNLQDGF